MSHVTQYEKVRGSDRKIMGRIGITYNDVAKAITEIQGKRQNPTVDSIREILGTGSRTTISKLWREWKERNDILPTDELGIPVELLNLVKNLWATVQDKSAQQLIAAQETMDAEMRQLRGQLQAEKQTSTELKAQCHTLEEDNHQFTQAIAEKNDALDVLKIENNRLNERLKGITERQQSQAAEQSRLHDLLAHMQKNLEHYQSTAQKLRQEQVAQLAKEKQQYEQKLAALQNSLSISERNLSAMSQNISNFEAIKHDYHALQASHDTLNHQFIVLDTEKSLLEKQLQELQQSNDKYRTDLASLQVVLSTEKTQLVKAHRAFSDYENKIQSLQQGNQKLAQEKAHLMGKLQYFKEMQL